MERNVIVANVETTGPHPDDPDHFVVEVAWWNLATGDTGQFVPPHDPQRAMAYGNPDALRLNRYVERLADAEQDSSCAEAERLHQALTGNTIAGANPTFDVRHLSRMFRLVYGAKPEPWHHQPLDLGAYAAGVLGLPLGHLLGLSDVARTLGLDIAHHQTHTAAGDVQIAGECFLDLAVRADVNRARLEQAESRGLFGRRRTASRHHLAATR